MGSAFGAFSSTLRRQRLVVKADYVGAPVDGRARGGAFLWVGVFPQILRPMPASH